MSASLPHSCPRNGQSFYAGPSYFPGTAYLHALYVRSGVAHVHEPSSIAVYKRTVEKSPTSEQHCEDEAPGLFEAVHQIECSHDGLEYICPHILFQDGYLRSLIDVPVSTLAAGSIPILPQDRSGYAPVGDQALLLSVISLVTAQPVCVFRATSSVTASPGTPAVRTERLLPSPIHSCRGEGFHEYAASSDVKSLLENGGDARSSSSSLPLRVMLQISAS